MSKICVIIATYNKSENLPHLLGIREELIQEEGFKIIIVDDNSPDKTADVARELNQHYKNIIIHRRPRKLGIGSAIRDGLKTFFPSKTLNTSSLWMLTSHTTPKIFLAY